MYTWAVVLLGTVLFRAGSLAVAGRVLAAMFTGWRFTAMGTLTLQRLLTGQSVFCLALGLLLGTVTPRKTWRAPEGVKKWAQPASYALALALGALCVLSMAQSGFAPFVYQQF